MEIQRLSNNFHLNDFPCVVFILFHRYARFPYFLPFFLCYDYFLFKRKEKENVAKKKEWQKGKTERQAIMDF